MPRRRDNPVVRAAGPDRFELVLDPTYRDALRSLLEQLDSLITESPDDPSTRRLHPPAYLEDPDRDAGYQLLAGSELRSSRHEAISVSIEILERGELTDAQAWAWLRALNSLRLVLGTRLGIEVEGDWPEPVDEDDPDAPLWAAFEFTTVVHHHLVKALSS